MTPIRSAEGEVTNFLWVHEDITARKNAEEEVRRQKDFVETVLNSIPDAIAIVNVEDRDKFVQQKQYRYDDQEVRPKAIYRYRVSSQLLDGSLSAPSNEVEIAR